MCLGFAFADGRQVIEPYIYDAIAKKTKGNPRAKKGKDTKDESDA